MYKSHFVIKEKVIKVCNSMKYPVRMCWVPCLKSPDPLPFCTCLILQVWQANPLQDTLSTETNSLCYSI